VQRSWESLEVRSPGYKHSSVGDKLFVKEKLKMKKRGGKAIDKSLWERDSSGNSTLGGGEISRPESGQGYDKSVRTGSARVDLFELGREMRESSTESRGVVTGGGK